jgi:hypothetical protein
MNLKQIKVISIIGIFLISFISHFMYDIFPCTLTSFFFPVNESIWEHMKILFTSTIIYGIIDYLLLKKNNISYNNFKYQLFLTSLLNVIIYLILYLPLYLIIGEKLIISILLMLVVYSITEVISYYILKEKNKRIANYLAIPLIIICYLIFIYLTYYPPKVFIFYDTLNKIYGIK